MFHQPGLVQKDEAGLQQKTSECCVPAPQLLVFDSTGQVIKSWSGPGREAHWPAGAGGLWVDEEEHIWMTAGGHRVGIHVPRPEARNTPWGGGSVFKFSLDGKLLLEIGRNPRPDGEANNQSVEVLGFPSSLEVNDKTHEVFIADGYVNRRVVVFDSETGAFKRGWGAYGIPLSQVENTTWPDTVDTGRPINFGQDYKPADPPSKQFRGPLTIRLSNDGFVYVGDEENDRIQVFTTEGKFVKEFFVAPNTLDEGSVMDVAVSRDPQQKYLLVADGSNQVVWVLNRNDGSVVTRFGHRGHSAGQFSYLHAVDTDSHGSIYTGEVKYNYRIQKFVLSR
jgi:DNA-binding beta-propeller fold protein YncE